MAKENVGQYIKRLVLQSGILGKLIAASTVVFLFFVFMDLAVRIMDIPPKIFTDGNEVFSKSYTEVFKSRYFAAPGNPSELLYKPWAIITHLFTHGNFTHFLFNMIALYFSGKIFIGFFGERRLLLTYFLGGLFAYLIHLLASHAIPSVPINGVVGASGSVMAIFIAAAVYRPSYIIHLFGVIKLPLFVVAALYLLSDLMGAGTADGIGHFAHLGGALFGGLSVINALSSKNFMNRIDRFIFKLKFNGFSFKRKTKKARKPKMKVHHSTKASTQTDDEYNADKVAHKARIDAILDKISKKGYEGLSKEEKDILFNESKR